MDFPDHLVLPEIKNHTTAFSASLQEKSQSRPTQGGKKQTSRQPEGDPIRAQGDPPQKGKPQCTKNQEDFRITEPLEFFNKLCDIENNLFIVFNKLSNSEYTNCIVNLSNYPLTNTEITVLS